MKMSRDVGESIFDSVISYELTRDNNYTGFQDARRWWRMNRGSKLLTLDKKYINDYFGISRNGYN